MSMTRTRWRARTWLVVAGVTLGSLVAAAPAISASPVGGQTGGSGPVVGTSDGAVRGLVNGAVPGDASGRAGSLASQGEDDVVSPIH